MTRRNSKVARGTLVLILAAALSLQNGSVVQGATKSLEASIREVVADSRSRLTEEEFNVSMKTLTPPPPPSAEECEKVLRETMRSERSEKRAAYTSRCRACGQVAHWRGTLKCVPRGPGGSTAPPAKLDEVLLSDVTGVDQEALDRLALTEHGGIGFKAANLEVLAKMFDGRDDIVQGGMTVAIPAFIPIPHDRIVWFLKEFFAVDVTAEWTKSRDDGEEPLVAATRIREMLDTKFPEGLGANPPKLQKKFRKAFEEVGRALLWKRGKQSNHIMVRSSGREDTELVANAGGNASAVNMKPTSSGLYDGLREVILSYFSEKSFKQRIAANDDTIDDLPLMAVLVQEMQGSSATNVFRSGVMYTREPGIEGVSYSVIQAAYGHNEGVVNSIVAVDTYYSHSRYNVVHSVVKPKKFRLDPGQSGLATMLNSPEATNSPALDENMIRTLTLVGELVQTFYSNKGALKIYDIEFTIDPSANTLYILQARPVQKMAAAKPQYLSQRTVSDNDHESLGLIVGADAKVTVASSRTHVIIAYDLRSALIHYQNLPKSSAKAVGVVLAKEMSPSTSHEAMEFRVKGIKVFYAEAKSADTISKWLHAEDKVMFDVQREVAVRIAGGIPKPKDGWFTYPIGEGVSVLENSRRGPGMLNLEQTTRSASILKGLRQGKTNVHHVLENIKRPKAFAPDAIASLTALNSFVYSVTKTMVHKAHLRKDTSLIHTIRNFRREWYKCCQILYVTFTESDADTAAARVKADRLFISRMLSSLAFQTTTFVNIHNSWSLGKLSSVTQEPMNYPHSPVVQQLSLLQDLFMTDTLKGRWGEFLDKLSELKRESTDDLFSRSVKCLLTIGNEGILSLWMNIDFSPLFDDGARTVMESLEHVCQQEDTLVALSEVGLMIDALDVGDFSRQETVADGRKQASVLVSRIEKAYKMVASHKSTSEVLNVLLLNHVDTFVTRYDDCLKTYKISPGNREDFSTFSGLLDINWDLFTVVTEGISAAKLYWSWNADMYKGYGSKLLQDTPRPDHTFWTVRADFNVAVYSYFARINPLPRKIDVATFEELFTVTHQSLVNALGESLALLPNVKRIQLPSAVATVCSYTVEYFKQTPYHDSPASKLSKPQIRGIANGELDVTVPFQMNAHGGVVQVLYNFVTGDMTLAFTMMGSNDKGRWAFVAKALDNLSLWYEKVPEHGISSPAAGIYAADSVRKTFHLTSKAVDQSEHALKAEPKNDDKKSLVPVSDSISSDDSSDAWKQPRKPKNDDKKSLVPVSDSISSDDSSDAPFDTWKQSRKMPKTAEETLVWILVELLVTSTSTGLSPRQWRRTETSYCAVARLYDVMNADLETNGKSPLRVMYATTFDTFPSYEEGVKCLMEVPRWTGPDVGKEWPFDDQPCQDVTMADYYCRTTATQRERMSYRKHKEEQELMAKERQLSFESQMIHFKPHAPVTETLDDYGYLSTADVAP